MKAYGMLTEDVAFTMRPEIPGSVEIKGPVMLSPFWPITDLTESGCIEGRAETTSIIAVPGGTGPEPSTLNVPVENLPLLTSAFCIEP